MKELRRTKQNVGLLLLVIMFIFGFNGVQAEEIGPILSSDIQISVSEDTWVPWGDIGFDGTNYLVAWKKKGGPIVGRFVDKNGNLVAEEFEISPAADPACAIAFNGTNYLIVYQNTGVYNVACRFITPQGVVSPEIKVDDDKPGCIDVAFAPNSSKFLVVWHSSYNTVTDCDVKAKVVSNDGTPQGNNFVVGNGKQYEFYPSVASDGTDFLVVWFNRPYANGEGDIYGARVNSYGELLDTDGIAICTGNDRQKYPQISYNTTSGNYLVVWDDTRGGYPYNIYGSRVSKMGDVLDGSEGIAISENAGAGLPSIPHVGFDGTNWLVVWSGSITRGTIVNSSGEVLDIGGFDITLDRDYPQWYTNIAFGGSNYLVVWAEQNEVNYTIHGQIVSTQIINNQSPIANAGNNQSVHPGSVVSLDGSASSDPDEDYPLTYAWTMISQPSESSASLKDADLSSPSFEADVLGDYTIELVVTDSKGLSSAADQVLVSTFNTPPMADAGEDQVIIQVETAVELDGSKSYDDEGDKFTYLWTITQKPTESEAELDEPNSSMPTFIADVHGDYVISLTVTDIFDAVSETDSVTVSFENVKPVADAGGNQSVIVGDTVFLDGNGSYDNNFDPLSFSWNLVSKPSESLATLSEANVANPSLIVDKPGVYVVSLVVNDTFVDSDSANVTIMAITTEEAAAITLIETVERVNLLDPESLKNKNLSNALTNKINAALAMIDEELYEDALDKLEHDILGKTNGCAEIGTPDKNDWIKTCDAQNQIYPQIVEVIELLRDII